MAIYSNMFQWRVIQSEHWKLTRAPQVVITLLCIESPGTLATFAPRSALVQLRAFHMQIEWRLIVMHWYLCQSFSPGLWGTNGKNKSHTFISSKPYDFPKKVLYKLWQFATSLFAKTPGTSGWIRMRQATRIKTKSSWEVSERGKQWRYDDYDGDINGDIIGL